jgi:hypothetical protein
MRVQNMPDLSALKETKDLSSRTQRDREPPECEPPECEPPERDCDGIDGIEWEAGADL